MLAQGDPYYLGLMNGVEPLESGQGYFRPELELLVPTTDLTYTNNHQVKFQRAVAPWGNVDGAALYVSRGTELSLATTTLIVSMNITSGDFITIPKGGIEINIDDFGVITFVRPVEAYKTEGEVTWISDIPFSAIEEHEGTLSW